MEHLVNSQLHLKDPEDAKEIVDNLEVLSYLAQDSQDPEMEVKEEEEALEEDVVEEDDELVQAVSRQVLDALSTKAKRPQMALPAAHAAPRFIMRPSSSSNSAAGQKRARDQAAPLV